MKTTLATVTLSPLDSFSVRSKTDAVIEGRLRTRATEQGLDLGFRVSPLRKIGTPVERIEATFVLFLEEEGDSK